MKVLAHLHDPKTIKEKEHLIAQFLRNELLVPFGRGFMGELLQKPVINSTEELQFEMPGDFTENRMHENFSFKMAFKVPRAMPHGNITLLCDHEGNPFSLPDYLKDENKQIVLSCKESIGEITILRDGSFLIERLELSRTPLNKETKREVSSMFIRRSFLKEGTKKNAGNLELEISKYKNMLAYGIKIHEKKIPFMPYVVYEEVRQTA